MFSYLKHQLTLAMPLIGFVVLIVGVALVADMGMKLSSPLRAASGITATLGEGVDAFATSLEPLRVWVTQRSQDANTWITLAALAATAISVVSALRLLSETIQGPKDAGALVKHVVQQAAQSTGVTATHIAWGTVRDARTGRPVPLARVSVMDERGWAVATSVADMDGRYGFHSASGAILTSRGISGLRVQHDGYHDYRVSVPVSTGPNISVHIELLPKPHMPVSVAPSRVARTLSAAAFWTGVIAVPMMYLALPGPVSAGTAVLFASSAFMRTLDRSGRDTRLP